MVASSPKIAFHKMTAPFQEIIDNSLYFVLSLLALQIAAFKRGLQSKGIFSWNILYFSNNRIK
jgi:hypothetical protein